MACVTSEVLPALTYYDPISTRRSLCPGTGCAKLVFGTHLSKPGPSSPPWQFPPVCMHLPEHSFSWLAPFKCCLTKCLTAAVVPE